MQENVYTQFKELIKVACGFSLEGEREETLIQAIQRRMNLRKILLFEGYHAVLIREPGEVLALIELLTVNETYFFREPEHLNLVVDTLIPELLAVRHSGTIRILSVGCSTGEEPYSIAMLLQERFGAESERLFSITAVDIDSKVIETAKNGYYRKPSFRGTAPVVLEKYFTDERDGRYRVCETIRNQVKFEVMNLLGSTYSLGMSLPDFIFYRNISIYFPSDVQKKVFSRLADLLNQGGYLIVGAAETLHHDLGILSMVSRSALFFFRKPPFSKPQEGQISKKHHALLDTGGIAKISKKPDAIHPYLPNRQSESANSVQRVMPVFRSTEKEYETALMAALNNQHDHALELVASIILHDDQYSKAHGLKASLHMALARFDEARKSAERLINIDPMCQEAFLMLGIIARHNGDDSQAFKRFREALYLNGSCWMSHFYSAEILYARQEHVKARGNYEAAVKILESDNASSRNKSFFPLSCNPSQFISICRHKLTILKEIR